MAQTKAATRGGTRARKTGAKGGVGARGKITGSTRVGRTTAKHSVEYMRGYRAGLRAERRPRNTTGVRTTTS